MGHIYQPLAHNTLEKIGCCTNILTLTFSYATKFGNVKLGSLLIREFLYIIINSPVPAYSYASVSQYNNFRFKRDPYQRRNLFVGKKTLIVDAKELHTTRPKDKHTLLESIGKYRWSSSVDIITKTATTGFMFCLTT